MKSEKFFHSSTAIVTLLAACFVVLISLGVRQTFGLFFIDFNESLNISNTAFGFAIGTQMLMWGLTGPIFGAIADRYGGHIAIISAFIFYTLGVYFLYSGPNTGVFFQIHMGLLIGIGLGGTAISIPMSIVGKHFPLSTRTIAMSIVTAVGSFGYFISPIFTNYSIIEYGWSYTFFIFALFLLTGLVAAFFVRSPKANETREIKSNQSFGEALSEAFKTKSYVLLVSGFFVCGFHITLVGTHVPKYVIDRGLENWTAAAILSLIGLFNIFGSLLSGYLSSKMSKKIIASNKKGDPTIYKLDIFVEYNIIKNKENREIAMKKTLPSIGGELIGYYGLIGQEYEVMMITKVDSLRDYMSLVAKAMLGGAVKDIKTVHLYTGEDVEHAATKALGDSITYTPAGN